MQEYQQAMGIGEKWGRLVEEVNKLRWFGRVVSKL